MLITIMGEMGAGKDTLIQFLTQHGFRKVPTYTTRPPRVGEVNGKDYHFLSVAEFQKKIEEGFFAEYYDYTPEGRPDWIYGSSKECFEQAEEKDLIILTPRGIKYLKENQVPVRVVYLKVPGEDRFEKAVSRGDKLSEIERRRKKDEVDFSGASELADYILENPGYKKTVEDLAKELLDWIGA